MSFGNGSKDMGSSRVAPRESSGRVAPECSEEFGNEPSVELGKGSLGGFVKGVSSLSSSLGSGKREFGEWHTGECTTVSVSGSFWGGLVLGKCFVRRRDACSRRR